jgi:polyferredoxin
MRGRTSRKEKSYTWKKAAKFLFEAALVLVISSFLIQLVKPYVIEGPPQWLVVGSAVLAILSFYALLTIFRGGEK